MSASPLVGRAVVIRKNGGPEVLELETSFSFPSPEADEVVIKTAAFSVNPVDVIVRNGVYGPIPQNPTVSGLVFFVSLARILLF